MVFNLGFWIFLLTGPELRGTDPGSLFFYFFCIYLAPVILPLMPFSFSFDSHPMLVPVVGALVLSVVPIFWSLVAYGIVRAVREIRLKIKHS